MKKKSCISNSFVTWAKRRTIPVTYKTVVLVPYYDGYKNVLTQDMINEENVKYIIKYDYWLNEETITVPENSILEFDGGTLHDGTIIGQDTFINNVGGLGVETLFGPGIKREGTWRIHEYSEGVTREEFDALLVQFNALKAKVDKYHPDTPEPTEKGYALFISKPSLEVIKDSVNPTASKPVNGTELDMSTLSRPTMCYFVYPLSWEIIENGLLIIPAVFDSNGFETGATIDIETPTVDVNGVTYRILDIRLGKGKYKVNFNK